MRTLVAVPMTHELVQMRGHSFWDRFGPSPVLVDLGANVGRFSAEFLARFPGAEVILAEGDPYLVELLLREFGREGRVRLFQGLVGAESRRDVSFHLCRVPEGNSIHQRFGETWTPGETREIRVEMISLPDLLARAGCDRVDLLKMDVEGSEWEILEHFSDREASLVQQLSVEFHDFMDPSLLPRTERCVERLRALGYTALCRPTDRVHGSPYFDCLFFRGGAGQNPPPAA
jgi:FkbM family methyltransferase